MELDDFSKLQSFLKNNLLNPFIIFVCVFSGKKDIVGGVGGYLR